MKLFKAHPAANLFPMMSKSDLAELAADIAANGQLLPIVVTSDNQVLDGRNRLEACRLAGVEPEMQIWDREDDGVSPTVWVMSANKHRRHMNESQLALVAVDALPLLEAEARQRMKTAAKKGAPRGAPLTEKSEAARSTAIAAKAIGASARSVQRAKAVLEKAPKAEVEHIRSGKKTLKQVEREIRKTEQVRKVRAYRAPEGEFSIIVTDPPWKFDDQLDGSDQARGGCPYPPMETEAICAMKMPLAADCIVFLFVTNTHLINGDATRVLNAWGLKGMTMATWPKTSIKTGWWLRGQTEHVIMAARGKPVRTLTNQSTLLPAWPSGEHSDKPAEFFPWVESLCPAPDRLEMFSRLEKREGWTVCGAEAGTASPKAGKKRRDNMRFVDAEAKA